MCLKIMCCFLFFPGARIQLLVPSQQFEFIEEGDALVARPQRAQASLGVFPRRDHLSLPGELLRLLVPQTLLVGPFHTFDAQFAEYLAVDA